MINLPLSALTHVLRPSTYATLTRRGFGTTAELLLSSSEGSGSSSHSTLAAELDVSLETAAGMLQEVLQAIHCSHQQYDDQNDETDDSTFSSTRQQKAVLSSSSITPNLVTASHILKAQTYSYNHKHSNKNNPHSQRSHHSRSNIVTFCRSIDTLLQGGIPLGQVTEVSGLPGSGKTQLALQVAIDCSLPYQLGGVQGQCLYIDCEGSFVPERCLALANACHQHVLQSVQRKQAQSQQSQQVGGVPDWFTPQSMLEGIHVVRVHDATAQNAVLWSLEESYLSNSRNNIKCIIIDSMAFHYRCAGASTTSNQSNNDYYLARTQQLVALASHLNRIAAEYHVAILVVNQMTTKLDGNNNTIIVPALGESWAHSMANRLLLSSSSSNTNDNEERSCRLTKSAHRPAGVARFRICQAGIRDVSSPTGAATTTATAQAPQRDADVANVNKRARTSL